MNKIRKAIKSNFALKILSLFIALILWVYVLNVQNPKDTREMMVYVKGENTQYLTDNHFKTNLNTPDNYKVTIKFEGRRLSLNSIKAQEFDLRIDYKYIKHAGTCDIPIQIYAMPKNIELLQIKPEYLRVKVYTKH